MRPREKNATAGLLFFVLLAASLAGLRAQDGDPAEELREKEEDRIGRLFEKVVPTLDEARKLVDRPTPGKRKSTRPCPPSTRL